MKLDYGDWAEPNRVPAKHGPNKLRASVRGQGVSVDLLKV